MWGIQEDQWASNLFGNRSAYPFGGFSWENPFLFLGNPVSVQPRRPRRKCRINKSRNDGHESAVEAPVSIEERSSTRKPQREPQHQTSPTEINIPILRQQSEEKVPKGSAEDDSENKAEQDNSMDINTAAQFKQQKQQMRENEAAVKYQSSSITNTKMETPVEDSKPSQSEAKLDVVKGQLEQAKELIPRIEAFQGSKQDKEYLYLEELLTRCILNLDLIETQGVEELRSARKAAVKDILSLVNDLESRVTITNLEEKASL